MRLFDKTDQKEICRLYTEEEWTLEDIRKHYHCRREAIRNVITSNGIEVKAKPKVNKRLRHDYFKNIDTEEKAYFLGLLFSDGSVSLDVRRSPQISLFLQVGDIDVIKKFKEEIQADAAISFDKRKGKETVGIAFRSKNMAEDLSKYGIIPNKTYNTNHLPDIPKDLIRHFLRGLLDGDGSIYQVASNGLYRIDFCSYHKTICEDFRKMIGSFGIENTNVIANYGTAYHIRYNTQSIVKELATLLYKDSKVSIARKYAKAEKLFAEDKSEEDIVYSDH